MSLCEAVAPYVASPLEGVAGCGVSGGTYPLLSMRLRENNVEQEEGEEEAEDAINTVYFYVAGGSPLSVRGAEHGSAGKRENTPHRLLRAHGHTV